MASTLGQNRSAGGRGVFLHAREQKRPWPLRTCDGYRKKTRWQTSQAHSTVHLTCSMSLSLVVPRPRLLVTARGQLAVRQYTGVGYVSTNEKGHEGARQDASGVRLEERHVRLLRVQQRWHDQGRREEDAQAGQAMSAKTTKVTLKVAMSEADLGRAA